MADFQLQIVTQEKIAFDGMVDSMVLPGADGYFGVLAHHAPLLALLGEGELTVGTGGRTLNGRLSGGFLEVQHNRATILADRVEGDFLDDEDADETS
ncbi:FoF1 ATP synthase subunit delta/epsilon [Candidatus Sumerlaeota bacterium]